MTQNIGEICTNKLFAAKISTTPLPAKKKIQDQGDWTELFQCQAPYMHKSIKIQREHTHASG